VLELGAATDTSASADRPGTVSAPPAPPASDPAFALAPFDTFAGALERPVFVEGRRPRPAAASSASTSAEFTLLCTVSDGGRRFALVETGIPKQIVRVVQGSELDGWLLEEVASDRVYVGRADAGRRRARGAALRRPRRDHRLGRGRRAQRKRRRLG
jgi:hypothetical protein